MSADKQFFDPEKKYLDLYENASLRRSYLLYLLQTLSDRAFKLSVKRSQKSRNRGRSIFFKLSFVLASTLTYNCVTGDKFLRIRKIPQSAINCINVCLLFISTYLMASGNWAFVTRKVEIFFSWRKSTNLLISGYMIGSPTSDRAQCWGLRPSSNRSGITPGTPACTRQWRHRNTICWTTLTRPPWHTFKLAN